jgi:hypothetical protein
MKSLNTHKRILVIAIFASIMVFESSCSKNGSGGDDLGSGFSKYSKIKVDPVAMTAMLYQGILGRTPDFPGSNGYRDYIARKGLDGVRDSGIDIAKSYEFKSITLPHYGADGVLKNMTQAFLKADPTNSDRSKFLSLISTNKAYSVAKSLLTDNRFYDRLLREQQTVVPGPSPAPVPIIVGGSCSLPAMPDNGNCPRSSGGFLPDVEAAIDATIQQHPEYFNLNDSIYTGTYRLVDIHGYVDSVVLNLQLKGYCAATDSAYEEIGVKNTNGFNEQYRIYTSAGYMRRGDGSYRSTCYPAAF